LRDQSGAQEEVTFGIDGWFSPRMQEETLLNDDGMFICRGTDGRGKYPPRGGYLPLKDKP
jgi:hypothetical protein